MRVKRREDMKLYTWTRIISQKKIEMKYIRRGKNEQEKWAKVLEWAAHFVRMRVSTQSGPDAAKVEKGGKPKKEGKKKNLLLPSPKAENIFDSSFSGPSVLIFLSCRASCKIPSLNPFCLHARSFLWLCQFRQCGIVKFSFFFFLKSLTAKTSYNKW